jgi:hypothetical protein
MVARVQIFTITGYVVCVVLAVLVIVGHVG